MTDFKVIVIGAGISGLKATSVLHENGIKDVKCLESRDRIGGRLYTVSGRNGKYDLGASWHHDTLTNKLFSEELSLPEEERAEFAFNDEDSLMVVDKDAGILDVDQLHCLAGEFEKWIELKYFDTLEAADKSYFDLCMEFCHIKRDLLTDDQLQCLPQLVRYMELWHGIDWLKLSGKWSVIEHNGRNAFVQHYEKIVNRISKPVEHCIELNQCVQKIKKLANGSYEVKTSDKTYKCDFCIVTIPQPVLALSCSDEEILGRIEFDPPLNESISKPLTSLISFASLGKVIFEFDSTKWSTDVGRVLGAHEQPANFSELVRNSKDIANLLNEVKPMVVGKLNCCWDNPVYFINMAKHLGMPSLIGLTQDPVTQHVENLTKEEVEEFFRPMINKVLEALGSKPYKLDFNDELAESDAPVLKNILTTSWSSDPNARGSYSACEPGDDPMEMVIAFTTGQGNIRFAGEHTIMEGAGCAHGAWESGIREANYILDKLSNL